MVSASGWASSGWAMPVSPSNEQAGSRKTQPRDKAWMTLREVGKELPPRWNGAGSPKPFLKVSQPLASQGRYQVWGVRAGASWRQCDWWRSGSSQASWSSVIVCENRREWGWLEGTPAIVIICHKEPIFNCSSLGSFQNHALLESPSQCNPRRCQGPTQDFVLFWKPRLCRNNAGRSTLKPRSLGLPWK